MQAVIFDFDGVIHDTLEDLHRVHCETLENLTLEEISKKFLAEIQGSILKSFLSSRKGILKKPGGVLQRFEDGKDDQRRTAETLRKISGNKFLSGRYAYSKI